ncbi:MAG: response regulator transcription factor [Acidobacteriota bacterium]|nr:response regulator transcription factor [Acidobacteriota bacterium]
MTNSAAQTVRKTVVVCDTQPVSVEGLRALLEPCEDLKYSGAVCSLPAAMELVGSLHPSVVMIEKALGLQAIADWLQVLRKTKTAVVVWGMGIGNAEALRLVQAGARGIVQKSSDLEALLACIRTAAGGGTWMSDTIFQAPEREMHQRSHLTTREHQVAELVEQGMRNKEIGHKLGIQTGTVKIHLKHIFEKTGCRGRYGLALCGLREKGQLNLAVM